MSESFADELSPLPPVRAAVRADRAGVVRAGSPDRGPARVDDLATLEPGTHLGGLYRGDDEGARLAASFVRAGLAAGERTMYVFGGADPRHAVAYMKHHGVPVRQALRSQQLLVRGFAQICGPQAAGDARGLARGLAQTFRATATETRALGFAGLRVCVGTNDAVSTPAGFEQIMVWEHAATLLLAEIGVSSVCTYDRRWLTAEQVCRVTEVHAGIAPVDAPPPAATILPIVRPWGLAVSGEVDASNAALLARALRARAEIWPDVCLDMRATAFLDVAAVRAIYQVASTLPATARIRLDGLPRHVRHVLDLVLDLAGFADPRVVIRSDTGSSASTIAAE